MKRYILGPPLHNLSRYHKSLKSHKHTFSCNKAEHFFPTKIVHVCLCFWRNQRNYYLEVYLKHVTQGKSKCNSLRGKESQFQIHAPNNDILFNDGPRIWQWSHEIMILCFSVAFCVDVCLHIQTLIIVLQLPTVFSRVACCLQPRSNRLYHIGLYTHSIPLLFPSFVEFTWQSPS